MDMARNCVDLPVQQPRMESRKSKSGTKMARK
jgi:hypothetical protein